MAKKSGDRRPYVKPVTRIELSEKNIRLRWILIAVFLSIAVVSIGMGVHYAVNVQPGWNEVQVASEAPNYSSEFRLMYDFSQTSGDAAAVNKGLIALYTSSMEEAYTLFSKDAADAEVHNLYYLNRHINEPVTVPHALYEAFALLHSHENRCLYLAPVYVEYNRVFSSESDAQAVLYDPYYNEEVRTYLSQLIAFIGDDSMIHLELMGNDTVCLRVSESYASFAEENGIEEYLDFGWMRNAFVADYVADLLLDAGYTQGYLASYDGFNRSLNVTEDLEFNIYDRQGMDIYVPAGMRYTAPMSIVFLRDYPLNAMDQWSYHVYENGRIVTSMIDPMDGVSKSALPNLVCCSREKGCAQILMEMIPVFLTKEWNPENVAALSKKGVWSVWCREGTVYYNQEDLSLTPIENEGGTVYAISFAP